MLKPSRATDYNIPIISPPVKHPKHCFDWWYRLFVIKLKMICYICTWHVLSEVMKRKAVDWCCLIRELKQTDAAAKRRRSISKFCSEGLKAKWVQSALDIIHSLIEWRFECDHLLLAVLSVCLKGNSEFSASWTQMKEH